MPHSPCSEHFRDNRPHYELDASGCWLWSGASSNGYGQMYFNGGVVYAHRFYFELYKRPIEAGLDLDHLCRKPGCVNPEHLEPVTRAQNVRRGRVTKLTEANVRDIRARVAAGEKQVTLAACSDVDGSTVSRIVSGQTWSDLA
jgi:hypothetical protein